MATTTGYRSPQPGSVPAPHHPAESPRVPAGGAGAWRLGHRPALDALRGAAVLAVIGYHAGFPGFATGGLVGVEVFFVLSGFLITSLLLERPGLGGFYLRRARRLLPALAVLLAVCGCVALLAGDHDTVAGVAWAAMYGANVGVIHNVDLGVFGHLWSLAVEEHFYALWPLVVLAARTPRRVALAAGVLAVGFAAWRWHLPSDERVYFASDTRSVGLLVGSMLGALRYCTTIEMRRAGAWVAGAALVVLTVITTGYCYSVEFLFVDVAAVALICGTLTVQAAPRLLAWFGSISYALYLWHWPVLVIFGVDHTGGWGALGAAGLSVGLAVLSGRLVESRFRQKTG